MTRFIIDRSGNLSKKTRIRKDDLFFESNKMWKTEELGQKIPFSSQLKLFNNPITAIAYDPEYFDNTKHGNFEFDKRDIIKALDFWINDKVLENERLFFQNGNKLDDVHEIELKNLINLKEKVVSTPTDTKFSRFYPHSKNCKILSTWTVEFYQISNLPKPYATGNYTLNFRNDGERFDFSGITEPIIFTLGGGTTDEISGFLGGGRHSDNSSQLGGNRITNIRFWGRRIGTPTNDSNVVTRTAPSNRNPNNWIVTPFRDRSGYWSVRDTSDNTIIASGFRSVSEAYRWIDSHRRQNQPLEPGDLVVPDENNPGMVRRANPVSGTNAEEQPIGRLERINDDGTGIIRLDSNDVSIHVNVNRDIGRDSNGDLIHTGARNVSGSITLHDGTEIGLNDVRLGTEPEHPDYHMISVPIEASSITVQDDSSTDIILEDMHLETLRQDSLEATGENRYVRVDFNFGSRRYDLNCELYITGDQIDTLFNNWERKTIRIRDNGGEGINTYKLIVDNQEYLLINFELIETIGTLPDNEARDFPNMYINRMSRTTDSAEVWFNDEQGMELHVWISDITGTLHGVLNLRQPFNVMLLAHDIISINGYSYRVSEHSYLTTKSRP